MKKIHKTILICGLGSALEWYDFALFGSLAPILANVFFHADKQMTSLLLVFTTFASGFLMRPIGAAYFGRIGDKYGRKAALSTTVILMAFSTTMIGLAPTYTHVGILAPIFITLMRLVQGFSASGEYPNAISLITEMSPSKYRGFYGSFSVVGVVAGMLLSTIIVALVTAMMNNNTFNSWGWRIPFLLSIPLGLLGFYLRYKMDESPIFQELFNRNKLSDTPIFDVINKKSRQTIRIFCIFLFSTVSFYIVFIYLPAHISNAQKITLKMLSIMNSVNIGILLFLIPFFGSLSDHYNRENVMASGIMLIGFFSYPFFLIVENGIFENIFFSQSLFSILLSMVVGPMAAFVAEQLPANIRTSGISLGLNFSASFFGGTAPLVSMYLIRLFGANIAPCFYLIFCALIGLFAILKMNSTKVLEELNFQNNLI